MAWTTRIAGHVTVGMTIIRNVEEGMEWVPGPYGAFVVKEIKWQQDEVFFTTTEAWGGATEVTFSYDGEETVTVKPWPG